MLLVSESGENGKGTLMRMAECLIGSGSMAPPSSEISSISSSFFSTYSSTPGRWT